MQSEHRLDSLLSREAIFLLNNLALVGLCFVILWGTFFPLISEAFTGEQSLGRPAVVRASYTVPLALLLVLLSGLGPALAWRRTTAANLRRELVAAGRRSASATLVVLLAAGVERRATALAMFSLGAFVLAVVAQEFARGVRARRAMTSEGVPQAAVSLVRRNRRRYGGYIVHVGVIVLLVGVAASSTFQDANDVRLRPGERAQVGGYEIQYVRPTGEIDLASNGSLEKINLGADLRVRRDGEVSRLHTERSYFPSNSAGLGAVSRYFEGEATSEVGLRAGLRPRPVDGGRARHGAAGGHDRARRPGVRGGHRAVRRGALRRARRDAAPPRRALSGRCAARTVPRPGLAARDVDLGRRADRVRGRADRDLAAARGRRAGCARPRRRASRASSAGPDAAMEVLLVLVVVVAAVLLIVAPLRLGRARGRGLGGCAAGGSRGRQGGQVPRDPRRRARLPHGQARARGLAAAGRRAARGRARAAAPARRARGGAEADASSR